MHSVDLTSAGHGLSHKWLVDDELRLGGEVEGVERVEVVLLLGGDVGDHDGVGRAPEGVLQQAGQLAVPVGHAANARVQGVHHLAEGEEGQVDGAALLQPQPLVAGATVVLGASQVHQVQLPRLLTLRGSALALLHLEEGRLRHRLGNSLRPHRRVGSLKQRLTWDYKLTIR